MDLRDLKLPERGFTLAEREWIANVLIPSIRTVHGIAGRNVSITDDPGGSGQTINASDCQPCP